MTCSWWDTNLKRCELHGSFALFWHTPTWTGSMNCTHTHKPTQRYKVQERGGCICVTSLTSPFQPFSYLPFFFGIFFLINTGPTLKPARGHKSQAAISKNDDSKWGWWFLTANLPLMSCKLNFCFNATIQGIHTSFNSVTFTGYNDTHRRHLDLSHLHAALQTSIGEHSCRFWRWWGSSGTI